MRTIKRLQHDVVWAATLHVIEAVEPLPADVDKIGLPEKVYACIAPSFFL